MLENVAKKDVFVSIAEALTVSIPNEPVEKLGIEKLKQFILFSFEITDELIDLGKPRNERKPIAFEVLDLIPFVKDITDLPKTFKQVIAEVRDLDVVEINEISTFISKKVPNFAKIEVERQTRMIRNIITVAFAIYEVVMDIKELKK